jgi:PAS domain S-box-containing protein
MMNEKDISSESAAALRKRAEALLLERSPQTFEALSPEKARELLHELQVHQIEAEMQNEELRRLQMEMEASRARYFDLYDLAPVGYLTVCEAGLIRERNFVAAGLLGVSRRALNKQPFTRFISVPFQDHYYLLCKRLLETRLPQTTELQMLGRDGEAFWARLEVSLAQDASGNTEFRIILTDITDRKKTEEALHESDAFQRDILNSLSAHIAVLDKSGRIIKVNEPWLDFAQTNGNPEPGQIGVGVNYFDVCHPACKTGDSYANAAVAGIQSVLAGTQTRFSLEYPCDGPDCKRWYEMEVLRPHGSAFGAIVTHTDISERKRAEEALRDANQKLRLHFEQTPMAVIEWDLDFRVTQWNPAAKTIFGYDPEEALGQHASFIVPEAVRPMVDGVFEALLKKSGGERSTNANVSKDGTPILCEWYNTPLIDERGTVAGVASVVMDITEQTESLELLAWEKNALEIIGSSALLHPVLDQLMLSLEKQLPGALCSVLLLDDDGVHVRHGAAPSLPDAYNRAIDGLAIGPAAGSCGTAAYDKRQVIVSDITTDPLWENYREIAAKHDLRSCWSTPILTNGGKTLGTFAIYSHEARSPAAHELDLIERAVHVVRIAIKRKHAEEEIRLLNASLERRVEERTAELEAANKELEAFTYSVSHDLRAPLRAVDGFSRMVIEDCAADLDANGQRMLGVIRSETQRMGRLIDDLLAFSRLGRLPIELLPIDMHRLARETYDELVAREPERQFRLDLHPLALAYGSEALIRQVWVNLLSNALKFTRKREISEIEIGTQQGEDGETIYYVKDNGSGFDMRHSSKLFGIFQRLHSQEDFSGTGVGLALVQRIVERHGGRIWAESELDRGAAFYFTLPHQKS